MNTPPSTRRLARLLLSVAATVHAAVAIAAEPVRIGVITDMSGPYSALAGPGVVVGVKMAVQEFGGSVLGRPIEVLAADSMLKVDVAVPRAREWYDRQGVEMIVESSDSATAIGLQRLAAEKKKITILTSGSTALTNQQCSAYGIQYVWDTFAMANGAVNAVMQDGGNTWFILTADYVFGKSAEADAKKAIEKLGGKVLGTIRHPMNAPDFGAFLLTAQQSGAKVLALANGGKDSQNALRQAVEFGLNKTMTVAPLMLMDTDVKGMGLNLMQGFRYTTGFYWEYDERSKEFSKRFFELHKGMPTMNHAGAYSATLQYLKAVKAANTFDADAVMKQLKRAKLDDAFARNGRVRDDGRMVHDMYQVEVKKPSESASPWHLAKVNRVIPGDDAFRSIDESTCALVKR